MQKTNIVNIIEKYWMKENWKRN